MSSYPLHEKNMNTLKGMGVDLSDYPDDPFESWNYDDLVDILACHIAKLNEKLNKLDKQESDR